MIEWSFGRFGAPSITVNPAIDVSSVQNLGWLMIIRDSSQQYIGDYTGLYINHFH